MEEAERIRKLYEAADNCVPSIHPIVGPIYLSISYIRDIFIKGARWADNHPVNVWHDINEEPKIGSNIVAINGNDKWWDIHPYDGDYSWRSWVSSYNIQRWAYIDDLLPK